MGLVRSDITYPGYSEKDRAEIKEAVERMLSNDDKFAKKYLLPVGVLLTSHPGNTPFLTASVKTHKKLGFWLTLTFDNYLNPERLNDLEYKDILPAKDVMQYVDNFILSPHQVWGGVMYPYFWQLKVGINALSEFAYIFCSNGDVILEKPENFPKIMELLGDNDIMGCGWEDNQGRPCFNTTSFIAKTDAAKAVMKHFQDHFIPFDVYEIYTQDFGNTEARFARAINELGLKQVIVEPTYNMQSHVKGYGTWYHVLGFRHIHAEYKYCQQHKMEPIELEYLDERFLNHSEYALLKQYKETGDRQFLEKWWAS